METLLQVRFLISGGCPRTHILNDFSCWVHLPFICRVYFGTGWEGIVSEMISTGAQVDQKDYPVLVDYLVKNFGPADAKPAGQSSDDAAAKKILNEACTACHDLDLVSDQHLSKDEWRDLVNSMVAKGASLSDKDTPILVDYLAKTYGPI